MPNIILKKTFKVKPAGFSVATEKSFSFHGVIARAIIDEINRIFADALVYTRGSNKPQFKLDTYGHYFAEMNHDCQKHHEEDLLVAILDVMENMGFVLAKQYDSVTSSERIGGSSETSRELFIFRHVPESHA